MSGLLAKINSNPTRKCILNMNQSNEIVIVVNSCDAYSDVWLPFFCAFRENWPDCKCKIILNTETKSFSFDGLNIISLQLSELERNISWGARLKKAVALTDSEYLLMLFDDFILEGQVDVAEVEKCLRHLQENPDISAFYFINSGIDVVEDQRFEGYSQVEHNAYYKINSAPGLWRRAHLSKYTGNQDTPWAWEFFGTARTFKSTDNFYVMKSDHIHPFKYQHQLGGAIHRGKWVEKVIFPAIVKYKIDLDLAQRGISTGEDYPHSLSWKIKFVWTGYQMIGFDVFIFIRKALYKRLMRVLNMCRGA